MSKVTQNYEQLALSMGMYLDGNVIYGERGGYELMIYATDSRYPYLLTVSLSAKPLNGIFLSKEEKKQFAKGLKPVTSLNQDGNHITMVIGNTSNQEKLKENLETGLSNLLPFLQARGYVPCCQFCGEQVQTTGYSMGNNYMHLCQECIAKMRQDETLAVQAKEQKKENLVGGIVGAFFGSLIGILCIIIFSQMGRIAAVSGVVMAVCTIKGYEKLGGKLTKKGIVVCIIMMLVMTFVGDRLDWAIMIEREFGTKWNIDIAEAFQLVPQMLAEGVIDSGSYWGNLAILYLFTIGGAVPTVSAVLKELNNTGSSIRQIGSAI